MKRIGYLFLSVFLATVATAQSAAEFAARVLPHESWSLMRLAGSDVGYLHSKIERRGELIVTSAELRMTMNRLGSTIHVTQTSRTREREDGTLVDLESVMDMSNQPSKASIRIEKGRAFITTEVMGREREHSVACPDEAVGPFRLLYLTSQHFGEKSTQWDTTTFSPDLQRATDIYTDVIGPEVVTVATGEEVECTKMIAEIDGMPMKITSWVDADGMPVRVLMPMAGLEMESILADEQLARAAVDAGKESNDVFEATVIRSREFIGFPRHADEAVLRVEIKDPDLAVTLPSRAGQEVRETDEENVREIRLRRHVPPAGKTGTRPLANPPSGLQNSLAANTMIQSDAKEIRDIATEVVGDETDAWRAAQKLERWVFDNLTEKGFDIGFASALEVCEDRAGDCSEHAVLLAALGRAAGIPTRVVMGVVYIGGIWGGHAWNEVWIEDDWYPLDATLGYGSVDPFHLSMTSMTMNDALGSEEFTSLIGTLGNLEIAVVESAFGDKRIKPDDAVRVDGDLYTNRQWNLSCKAPAGFEHEPAKPRPRIDFEILEIEGKTSTGKSCDIELAVLDTPVDFHWATMVPLMTGGAAKDEGEVITVDGREGRLVKITRDDRHFEVAFVNTGRALFIFTMDRIDGDADRKTFADFLKTVDFDYAQGA